MLAFLTVSLVSNLADAEEVKIQHYQSNSDVSFYGKYVDPSDPQQDSQVGLHPNGQTGNQGVSNLDWQNTPPVPINNDNSLTTIPRLGDMPASRLNGLGMLFILLAILLGKRKVLRNENNKTG